MTLKSHKSLDNTSLADYVARQLNQFFPDRDPVDPMKLRQWIDRAEERVYHCLSNIRKKYFNEDGTVHFNHLISDQYCMFLYMLSNYIYREGGDPGLSTKLYNLNKALHCVDIYFTTRLPDIFLLVHPLGTIIGRAQFSDYFIAYQGCTVGCLNDGVFPEFRGKTIMYANSSVLGHSVIGDNVCLAAGSTVVNETIGDNKVVLGNSPGLTLKENHKDIHQRPPYHYG
jgi:serine O-acetyltransferase